MFIQVSPVWTGVDSASQRLRRSTIPFHHRRLDRRHVAVPRAVQAFSELLRQLRESNQPSQFYVQHVQTPIEAVILIRAPQIHTGVSNTKNHAPLHAPYVDTALRPTLNKLLARIHARCATLKRPTGDANHFAPLLRLAFAAKRQRHPHDAAATGTV